MSPLTRYYSAQNGPNLRSKDVLSQIENWIRLIPVERLTIFIALSLGLHLLLKSGLFSLADYYLEQNHRSSATEVELVEDATSNPKTPREKALIKQLKPLNQIKNDDSQARFDSEQTQRVEKETQARNTGLTQNSQRSTGSAAQANNQSDPSRNQKTSETGGDLPEFTRMNYGNPNRMTTPESTISQILPSDIAFSNATNLNTDANTYYSFYSRVEELFYVRWGERLDFHWNHLSFDFKKNQLGGRTWSTTLEVLLTSTGEYHSSKIFQSSGYPPFDEAAIFAFKDARFFPNPPKAKIDPDGFVRLHYRLAVRVGDIR
jgi:TonB family protein